MISNNFGRRKNDPAKDRKALATYVELKGYKHGRPNKETIMDSFSLEEIAKGDANKVFIPFEATKALSSLGAVKEVMKDEKK